LQLFPTLRYINALNNNNNNNNNNNVRRWCKLLRHEKVSHIVVVIVEAVGATDFANFVECFPFLADKFPMASLFVIYFGIVT